MTQILVSSKVGYAGAGIPVINQAAVVCEGESQIANSIKYQCFCDMSLQNMDKIIVGWNTRANYLLGHMNMALKFFNNN